MKTREELLIVGSLLAFAISVGVLAAIQIHGENKPKEPPPGMCTVTTVKQDATHATMQLRCHFGP